METRLERLERIETRNAIEDLNTDFCHFLDSNMVEEMIELFTEDARYSHGSRVSNGRDEIREIFTDRCKGSGRTSRHIQTGLKITLLTINEARGKSICTTFAHNGPPPITPATPYLVADFIDQYQYCVDGRWRIKNRHIERIFVAQDNTGPEGTTQNNE